jgi:LPS O-antigen subunit length determinant protein (WzzB/FepE family)
MIAGALQVAQKKGLVRPEVDADEAAAFIVAAIEGCISLAKTAQDPRLLAAGERQLNRYLETLRM